tara:strand:+ start:5402 stop:5521 length:120 start_codon:yes stop_codon:yes gene_type:complete
MWFDVMWFDEVIVVTMVKNGLGLGGWVVVEGGGGDEWLR